jgi:hypothetical protein
MRRTRYSTTYYDRGGAPQFATLPSVTPGEGANTSTALPLAKAGGGEETYLDKMEMPGKSCKRGAEIRQSQSDSEDKGSMDENHIPTGADSDHPDSDMELDKDDLEVASKIDPTYVNDINSELQDQRIGVAGDAFSTQVQILGHSLRNGKLTLKVLLGDSMVPVDADWTDIQTYLLNYEHVKRCSDEYTHHFWDIYSSIFATLDIITVELRIKVVAQIMVTTTHWKGH